MKNVYIILYFYVRGYRNPYSTEQYIKKALEQQGFRVRKVSVDSGSYRNNEPYRYGDFQGYYAHIYLSVPRNNSISLVRNQVVSILSTFARIHASAGYLGDIDETPNVVEDSIEVIKEVEEQETTSDNSLLHLAGGFFLGWLASKKIDW